MKNEMKQTAVMKLLQYILVDCRNKDGVIQFSAHETFNEYLEIEKKQIIDACNDNIFCDAYTIDEEDNYKLTTKGELYYNDTFNN